VGRIATSGSLGAGRSDPLQPRRSAIRAAAGRRPWSGGANHDTATERNTNGYLAESVVPLSRRNFITGRIELADKDELFPKQARPSASAHTRWVTTRDIALFSYVETGIGAKLQLLLASPTRSKPVYGDHPVGRQYFCSIQIKEKYMITIFLALALAESFTGVVTDTMCGAKHTMMKNQPDDQSASRCA